MPAGLLAVGTVDPVDAGGGTLSVTVHCPTGFKPGDTIYFGEGNSSGGVNLGGVNDHETYDADVRNWYAWQFTPSGQNSVRLWVYFVTVGDALLGLTSKTFVMTGGGVSIAQTGGQVPGGVVLRAGSGTDSEHRIASASISVAGSYNDYGRSASGVSPRSATILAHNGIAAAVGKQIVSFIIGNATVAKTTVTPTLAVTGVTCASQLNATNTKIVTFGYELLTANTGDVETAATGTLTWDGGGSNTLLLFRVAMRHLLESAPTAAFSVVPDGFYIATVDMAASSDPEDLIPDTWDVDWGDGDSDLGLDRGAGVSTKSHAYAAGGTYTVTVTVYDSLGVSDDQTHDVTVTEPYHAATPGTPPQRFQSRRVVIRELPHEVTSPMFDDL